MSCLGLRRILPVLTLLAATGFAATPQADAGTYSVRQCAGSSFQDFSGAYHQLGSANRVKVVEGCTESGPGKVGIYQNREGSVVPRSNGGQFMWTVPRGVEIVGTALTSRLKNVNGIKASLQGMSSSFPTIFLGDGGPHDGELRTSRWSDPARPQTVILARLQCERSAGCENRPESSKAYLELTDIEFTSRDVEPPVLEESGPLRSWGGDWQWHRGNATGRVAGTDVGAGVAAAYLEVNGLRVDPGPVSCPGDHSAYSSRFSPCPGSVTRDFNLPTSMAPFQEGGNRVRFCVEDYAGSPAQANRTCGPERLVLIDSAPSAPPVNLRPVGGSGWRPENHFEFIWTNPGGQLSPIEVALYRVVGQVTGQVVKAGFAPGQDIEKIGPIEVPAPGEYRFEVQLIDTAGNLGAEAVTTFRFDDRRPSNVRPEPATGWISADELPLRQPIERAEAGGPSGVGGYALAASNAGPVNPCPSGSCLPFELDLKGGPDQRTGTVTGLTEGSHWISAVAASGAGLASEQPGSRLVRVDRTEPATVLDGPPGDWINRPVTVHARSIDLESGMEADPENDDGRPLTVIEVEGQAAYRVPGNEAKFTVTGDGRTKIRFWARDLAGNANDGLPGPDGDPHAPPGTATVKIDTTAPKPVFLENLDRADPELVRASVEDRQSGLESGTISLRRIGGKEPFRSVPTQVVEGRLTARVPSDDLPAGNYEFRAEARDRAGNHGSSSTTEDGTAMVLELPLKRPTRLTAGVVRGRATRGSVRSGYGRQLKVKGRLTQVSGKAIPGARLTVEERFRVGSRQRTRRHRLRTDGAGRYLIRLGKGPSRRVRVRYLGSRTLSSAAGRTLRIEVVGRVGFRLHPGVVRNRGQVKMTGKVGMRGALRPAGGKLVAIQYFDPGRRKWRPVEVLRTNRRGRYRYRYRFRTISSAQRIIFRATALPESGWPYLPSTSARRSVIVYPQGSTEG